MLELIQASHHISYIKILLQWIIILLAAHLFVALMRISLDTILTLTQVMVGIKKNRQD